ncbi:MAG: TonB-dependent receptor [Bacteroidia bacterium]|nr:TonB-dependent receptor [Bacteroidia bacterium]
MENFNSISFLKLRASYGLIGNAEIGNFDSQSLFEGNTYGEETGTEPETVSNPDLKWETTRQFDIGVDMGFLRDRISFTVDYYNKDTRDLLLNVQVPSTTGFTTQTKNLGRLTNQGIEFSINSQNFVGAFKWSTNFNISRNVNEIKDLNGQILAPGNRSRILNEAREGEPIGVLFGVKFAGVDPANGDALYFTEEGTTTNNYSAAARQVIGDPNPAFIGGLTNNFGYKGFDLSIFLQFVVGNDVYNMAGGFMSASADFFDNQTVDQLRRWQNPGDITDVPQARLFEQNGARISSRYVEDGSYLRFKTVTLGYNVPAGILSKIKMRSARLYVTGQNLFTITDYSGWDPEVTSLFTSTDFQSSNIIIGNDFYTPPQARTIIFGINVGF